MLSAFALIVFAVHFTLFFALKNAIPEASVIFAHIFLFTATGLVFSVYHHYRAKHIEMSGYIFGAASMAKMILAVVFLLPWILKNSDANLPFIIQFLVLYVLYLLFESIVLIRSMKRNDMHKGDD